MKKILLSILCLFSIFAIHAEEVTVTFSEQGYGNAQEVTELVINSDLVVAFSKGGNSSTTPKYYNTGNAFRLYAKNTMTITAQEGTAIKSIVMTTGSGENVVNAESSVSLGKLEIDGTTATISDINSNSVVFTQGGSKGHVRIVTMTISYEKVSTGATLPEPVASVNPGTIYNATEVELSGEGTIYYTTDGTEPTTASTVYSGAIAIDTFGSTTTIKAIAIDGEDYSDVATYSYNLKVANPVFSVKGGVYVKLTGENALKFTTETTTATILYNNRGGDPITAGSKTYGQLSVLSTATVKAVAFVKTAEGDSIFSDIVEEDYIISPIKPFKATMNIVSGNKYAIACDDVALIPHKKTVNYGYMSGIKVTAKGEFIETNDYYSFTFTETETEGEYTIMGGDNRYLYSSLKKEGEYYNSINVGEDISDKGDAAIWTVSIDDDFTASITNKASGFTLQYSTQYKNFETKSGATNLPILYELGEYPTLDITPANWSTLPAITEIVVRCESGIALNESDDCYATYRGDDYITKDLGYGVVSEDGKSVVYTLETPIEANGDYFFTFPAGLFTLNPDGLAIESSATNRSYTVDNPNILELVYANPDNMSNVKSIEYLYFEFNQDIFDNVNDAVITDDNGNEYPLQVTYTDGWGESTPYYALCLKTTEPITTPGTYTFVLKKEYIYAGDNIRIDNDLTYTFNITESLKVVSISPIEGTATSSIDELIIECNQDIMCWAEAFYVTGSDGSERFFAPSMTDKDGNELPYNMIRLVADTPITTAGTYTLYIEDYNIVNTDYANQEILPTQQHVFEFDGNSIVTGIEGIEAENGNNTIFDITGRKIEKITKPGLYIINGKKVIIK